MAGSSPSAIARTRAALALVGGWLLFFAPAIFSGDVPYERDILVTVLPLRQYLRERLLSGQLPQWYPYEMLGVPFTGSIVASPFHPQTLLFLLLTPSVATKWSILLAYLLGLIGMYRLARTLGASRLGSTAGAYAFAFGGYAVSLCNNPPFLVPLMTLPWALASARRLTIRRDTRDVAAYALWSALIFLGGDAQLFLECGLVAVALVACGPRQPRTFARLAMGLALGGVLTSVELVPGLIVEAESIRALWTPSTSLASAWAFSPLRLADFVIPHFTPMNERYELGAHLGPQADLFASTVFIGVVSAILALLGSVQRLKLAWMLTAVAGLGLWLALGHAGGLLELWWMIAPPFAKFRYPEKYIGLVAVALGPLVALGLDRLSLLSRRAVFGMFACGIALMVVGLIMPAEALLVAGLRLAHASGGLSDLAGMSLAHAWTHGLAQTGVALVMFGALLFAGRDLTAFRAAIPVLMFLELWIGNHDRMPLAARTVVDDPGDFARVLDKARTPGEPLGRVVPFGAGTSRSDLPANELVRQIHLWLRSDDAGRDHLTSFNANSSVELARTIRFLLNKDSPSHDVWWPRFNACYRVRGDQRAADEQLFAATQAPDLALVSRACSPRAFLAKAVPVPDSAGAAEWMHEDMPEDTVVWEGGPGVPEGGGTVRWEIDEPEYLRLTADANMPSALVVLDAFAAGWTAVVDGQSTPIHATNGAARGISVPAGHHLVELRYSAPGLKLGSFLSLAGLVVLSGLVLRRRRSY